MSEKLKTLMMAAMVGMLDIEAARMPLPLFGHDGVIIGVTCDCDGCDGLRDALTMAGSVWTPPTLEQWRKRRGPL